MYASDKVEWVSADRRLPVAANLAVEVAFGDGSMEIRNTVTGDWREVVRWRSVDKAAAPKKKKP